MSTQFEDSTMSAGPATRTAVLVVTSDKAFVTLVMSVVGGMCRVRVARSLDAARTSIAQNGSWAGFVLDTALGHANVAAWLAHARACGSRAPVALMAHDAVHSGSARAVDPLATTVDATPSRTALLAAFAYLLAFEARSDRRVSRVLEAWTVRHALTAREVELVLFSLAGTSRGAILREKSIAPKTLRSQVRGLLRKIGAASLVDVRARLLADALREGKVLSDSGDRAQASVQAVSRRLRLALIAAGLSHAGPAPVPEAIWQVVTPLLPVPLARPKGGRPPVTSQRVFEAFFHRVRTDCSWRTLPLEFGDPSTIRRYLAVWKRTHVLAAIAEALECSLTKTRLRSARFHP